MLPFSREQFVGVSAEYNATLGPLQSAAPLLGLVLVVLLLHPSPRRDRLIGVGLAALWVWTGVVYHGLFFARINAVAWGFGALFVLQGGLLWHAVVKDEFHFAATAGARGIVGWALIAYAVGLYPLVGLLSGQPFEELPAYGFTPCPLTLTTLGCLLLADATPPHRLWAIPLLWSLVGGSAAVMLAMPQDWPLLAGGLAASVLWVGRERRHGRSARAHAGSSAGPSSCGDSDRTSAARH